MFNNNKGFTFLELIVTVLVFTLGILGAYAVTQYILFYAQISTSRLTASFLAQEGIELLRNIRDRNWLEKKDWHCKLIYKDNPSDPCNFDGCVFGTRFCEIDYNDFELTSYSGSTDPNYLKRDANGFYNYDSGNPTFFKRKITIDPEEGLPGDPDYLKVIVSVDWKEKGKSHTVTVQENLYPWWKK